MGDDIAKDDGGQDAATPMRLASAIFPGRSFCIQRPTKMAMGSSWRS